MGAAAARPQPNQQRAKRSSVCSRNSQIPHFKGHTVWRSGSCYKKGVQPFITLLQGFSTTWGTHKEEELEFKPAP